MGSPDTPGNTKLDPCRDVFDLRSNNAPIISTTVKDQLHGEAGDSPSPLGLRANIT